MSTLETRIREHYEQVADRDQPPSSISIAAASSRGRSALRWRGARRAGVPALAGIAVLAVALAGVLPFGAAHRAPDASLTAAPRQFNPLVPYAAFSWLPAGESISKGGSNRVVTWLTVGQTWQLSVYAAGQCRLAMLAPGSDHHPAPYLSCRPNASEYALHGTAPAVGRHETFWGPAFYLPGPGGKVDNHSSLVWAYARGAWAVLQRTDTIKNPVQTMFRVARAVKFGSAVSQPDKFPVQLTHVPADWQVSTAYFRRSHGMQLAGQYDVTKSSAVNPGVKPAWQFSANLPELDIFKSQSNACYFYPGGSGAPLSVRRVINGYHVILSKFPVVKGAWGGLPWQELCAPDADGLSVMMTIYGPHPVIPLTTLFRNMKLLGVGTPSRWATEPIG